MCRGVEEEATMDAAGDSARRVSELRAPVSCELCSENAAVYCEADKGFLCRKCDQWVHSANFLARRHVRRVICTACQKATRLCLVGDSFNVVLPEIRTIARREEDSGDHHKVPYVFL